MRQLQLQNTNMSGPDVADWQTFLKKRGILQTLVDSVFGPKSDQATRGYQAGAGLFGDGVVGSTTMTKAVTDGYQSSTGVNLWGMDANIDCAPFAGDLAGQGVTFVGRYYSSAVGGKNLTPAEAQELSAAGLAIVAVYEDFNNSVGHFSTAAGTSQATRALQLAAAIGQPAGTAIYFAVDFDPLQGDVNGPIADYFGAIKDVLTAAPMPYFAGVYGSGMTCRIIRDSGLAKFTWLTGSIGFAEYSSFRLDADLVQLAPERPLLEGKLSIDDDIAQSADIGSFRVAPAT